ncbi:hypothetical protein BEWA_024240 [Theileria equi strain WA]|uniref:DUF6827 domain-containing protein n=1 Tax=Theileria equi strain WA TaxID=1537102 RepID=L0AVJ9_THEEQ|nr:hypothetical protein BEWA_024240 [Theileria equi strain WA]AFZ79575.1 hypothetical protein BEWA_024240 [Theileria equi strain WA]|eukprot:XP_004829241.1 hypothetical protein BEWA_024240 [Theileria equi strain WA]
MLPKNCTRGLLHSACKEFFSGTNGRSISTFSGLNVAVIASRRSSGLHRALGSTFCRSFHAGHHHEEPPHYAYRGDGLPKIQCEKVQEIIHINERQTHKTLQPMRPSKEPLYRSECSPEAIHLEAYNDLLELHNKVLAANWHDTVKLTMNADIWDGIFSRIKRRTHDIPDIQVQIMLNKTLEIFDALYQVEDVQDHIYELIEELSINASEGASAETSTKVTDNLDQHIAEILKKYEQLKQRYPRYASKIQDTIGYSLAILRQRYTFTWPEEHKYFY